MPSLYAGGFPFNNRVIPRRLTLAGLLSWRQPATLRFPDGVTVLRGGNGRGKSALVDAITFALFARHRAGASPAELLNADADQMHIEFEFEQEGARFCIHRSVKRTKHGVSGAQHIEESVENEWRMIAETDRRAGFDEWIRKRTGWTWEAFRVAVLLSQGRADRLLDEPPAARAAILGSVCGLEDLKALHALAERDERKAAALLATLTDQAAATPVVTDAELNAAANAVEKAEASAAATRDQVLTLHRQRDDQQRRHALEIDLNAATQMLTVAEVLMQDAAALDADAARMDELSVVVPRAEALLMLKGRILDLLHKSERMQARQAQLTAFQASQQSELAKLQQERTSLQARLNESDSTLAKLTQQKRELELALQAQKQQDGLQPERERRWRRCRTGARRTSPRRRRRSTGCSASASGCRRHCG
jgi:DNA repair protein SbcC/Rad50